MVHERAAPALWHRLRRHVARRVRARRFLRSVRHLHGPAGPMKGTQGVVVVVLVRDGMYYLDAFLRHYRALGAAQFVFCDNGSTDGTIARLNAEPDTVILESKLPFLEIENEFRRYAAERYARGRWCLFADIDEMFDFEGADRIGLDGLERYLTSRGYTALIAQMLEMFPKGPLRQPAGPDYDTVLDSFRHYDLRGITRLAYHDSARIGFSWYLRANTLGNPGIDIMFGGIRNHVFGEMCCLTKHPLVHVRADVQPGVHPHCAANVACADFTALIRHYKFARDPGARGDHADRPGTTAHANEALHRRAFRNDPDLSFWSEAAEENPDPRGLADKGFLVRSDAYGNFLAEQAG